MKEPIVDIFMVILNHIDNNNDITLKTVYHGKTSIWCYDASNRLFINLSNNTLQIELTNPKKTSKTEKISLKVDLDNPAMFPYIDNFMRRVMIEH